MKQILLFVIILVLIPFCFSIGCIAFDPDAPKKDPEYSRAVSKGAKAKQSSGLKISCFVQIL